MNAVFYRLTQVHRRVDEEISRELARPAPSSLRLLRLRTLKLVLKQRLRRQTAAIA